MPKMLSLLSSVLCLLSVIAIQPEDMSTKSPYANKNPDPPFGTHHHHSPSCTPTFVSFLARHGSRSATSEGKLTEPRDYLTEALSAGLLTDEGERLLAMSNSLLNSLQSDANFTWGGLSPLGEEEHEMLGSRTFKRFSKLLGGGEPSLTFSSTVVQRTMDSRDHFISGMKAAGLTSTAKLNIVSPTGCDDVNSPVPPAFVELRFFDACQSYQSYLEDAMTPQAQSDLNAYLLPVIEQLHADFFDTLFTEGKSFDERADFVDGLYGSICGTDVDVNEDYSGVCSTISVAQGRNLSFAADLGEFIEKGDVPGFPIVTSMSCVLFDSWASELENAISGKLHDKAHFRFAHAETTIPVVSELGLVSENPFELVGGSIEDIEARQFNGNSMAMMANNLMFVLWDCGADDGGYKIELLQNEEPRLIEGCDELLCDARVVVEYLRGKSCGFDELESMCGGLSCPS